jgi:hypothetical protein
MIVRLSLLLIIASRLLSSYSLAGTNEPASVTIDLVDGSRLRGTTTLKVLTLRSEALGKLSVPLERFRQVKFSKDRESVTVTLQNGDKIQAGLADTTLALATVFGPVTVPLDKVTEIQVRIGPAGVGRAIEWETLPYPTAHDWPGPRGKRAEVEAESMLVQGQPVRSRETFRAPITVSCEVTCENLHVASADFLLEFVPTGLAKDAVVDKVAGTQRLSFGVGSTERLAFCCHDGARWREVWTSGLPAMKANEPHRMEIELGPDRLRVRVDGQEYDAGKVPAPPEEFHLQLWNWQPSSRWRVKNVTGR